MASRKNSYQRSRGLAMRALGIRATPRRSQSGSTKCAPIALLSSGTLTASHLFPQRIQGGICEGRSELAQIRMQHKRASQNQWRSWRTARRFCRSLGCQVSPVCARVTRVKRSALACHAIFTRIKPVVAFAQSFLVHHADLSPIDCRAAALLGDRHGLQVAAHFRPAPRQFY